jgi:hypothetical protein
MADISDPSTDLVLGDQEADLEIAAIADAPGFLHRPAAGIADGACVGQPTNSIATGAPAGFAAGAWTKPSPDHRQLFDHN